MQQYKMIAKTFMGLEPVLAEELTQLGADEVEIGRRMVSFSGDKALMYRANYQLRTAIRILKPIATFKARTPDDVYAEVRRIDWAKVLTLKTTFAVDSVVYSEVFTHSKFVAYRVKDAIVDQFREATGMRPNISVANPDIRLHIHIADETCTLCLDSSGDSLHRRGYRQESVEAPLNEVLAAGMILMTGWRGERDFIDPMCGSGTIPIEAALIAGGIAPGVFRQSFAFERWQDFDKDLFDAISSDDSQEHEPACHIYGYDIDPKNVGIATLNVRAAGLTKCVTIAQQDFADYKAPAAGDDDPQEQQPQDKPLIVMNPPYGERISTPDLLDTYRMIGQKLKQEHQGGEAWVLSYREECFDKIGLRPSLKTPLYNGSLECEFRKYQLFSGTLGDFKKEGGITQTEEELKAMQEKRRFKRDREEFKKRLDDEESNEEADIRSFTFHSFEHKAYRDNEKEHGERRPFRRPFHRDGEDGERKPFRKTFHRDGDEQSERRPYRKPFHRDGDEQGERRPFRKPFHRDGDEQGERRPFRKPYNKDDRRPNRPAADKGE